MFAHTLEHYNISCVQGLSRSAVLVESVGGYLWQAETDWVRHVPFDEKKNRRSESEIFGLDF